MYKIISQINDSTCYAIKDKTIFVLKKINANDIDIYKAIININNPNIAKHFEFTSVDDSLYVVEEYIKGITLKEYCETNHPLPSTKIVEIANGICNGLNEIHQLGIVHRDITPTNIMIDPNGKPIIIDFGISRINKPNATTDTQILGTQGFAAPEQFGFYQTDQRADIYSMGVLINYMATLKLPHEQMPNNSLDIIIKKCLEMDTTKRYANINQLSNALSNKTFESKIRSIPGFRKGIGWHIIIACIYYVLLPFVFYLLWLSGKSTRESIFNILIGIFSLVLTIPFATNYKDWVNRWSFTKKLTKGGRIAIQGFFVFACLLLAVIFILLSQ